MTNDGPVKIQGDWTPPFIPIDTIDLTEFLYLWAYTRFWKFDTITEEEKAVIGNFIYQWLAAIISGGLPIHDLPLPPPKSKREVELPLYKGIVTARKLRVRMGPGITYLQVESYPWVHRNEDHYVYEERIGKVFSWLRISHDNELFSRWIAKKYIQRQE